MTWGQGKVLVSTGVFAPWLENRPGRTALLGALHSGIIAHHIIDGFDWSLELHELKAWAMDCLHGRPSLPYPWSAADASTRQALLKLETHAISLHLPPLLDEDILLSLITDIRDIQRFVQVTNLILNSDTVPALPFLNLLARHTSETLHCSLRLSVREATPPQNIAIIERTLAETPDEVRIIIESRAFIDAHGKLHESALQGLCSEYAQRIVGIDIAAPVTSRNRTARSPSILATGTQSNLLPTLARAIPEEMCRIVAGEVPLNRLNLLKSEVHALRTGPFHYGVAVSA